MCVSLRCKKKEKNLILFTNALTSFLFIYAFMHFYCTVVVQNATKQQFIAFAPCYLHGWEKSRVAVHALDMLLLIFLCSILYRFLVFLLLSFFKMKRQHKRNLDGL